MGRTACTEPRCLYKGALYLTVELYLYSPYGPYGLYRASVPVQGCTLLNILFAGPSGRAVWSCSPAKIVGSNPTVGMDVCRSECCVLSSRGPRDELITRPEQSYRLWHVVVCDLEAS
jgi:hypothetical protein